MGINYVLMPPLQAGREAGHHFYGSLLSAGIDFTSFAPQQNRIKIERKPSFPLEILVVGRASAAKPFGQLLVIAPEPNRPLENFASEVQAILDAFQETWPAQNRQIISCDVSLRCLYPSTSRHAFAEIWEERLGQSPGPLQKLGRQVLGGGLRFVLSPQPGDPEPTRVEVKIESYLQDTKMVFVETQFIWPEPRPPGSAFDPVGKLQRADQYLLNEVQAFMTG
jgi:hypothetical protein